MLDLLERLAWALTLLAGAGLGGVVYVVGPRSNIPDTAITSVRLNSDEVMAEIRGRGDGTQWNQVGFQDAPPTPGPAAGPAADATPGAPHPVDLGGEAA
ncbi:MAG: hypothetical protein HY722_02425, partial [Planctomycetes bacterium]|nr:hypothetical protein [Planctomycetota bacterium]